MTDRFTSTQDAGQDDVQGFAARTCQEAINRARLLDGVAGVLIVFGQYGAAQSVLHQAQDDMLASCLR